MRVLIIDPDRSERTIAEKILGAERHEVRIAADPELGLASVEAFNPDVVLIEQQMPRISGVEAVRRLRASELSGHRYLIVTAGNAFRGDLAAAFAAGADDFMRKPHQKEELLARVDAPLRIRRWAARTLGGSGGDWTNKGDLTQLVAWREAAETVSQDLASLFGLSFRVESSGGAERDSSFFAMLPLYLPEEEKEIHLFVGADEKSAEALGEMMFCHPQCSHEEIRDLLCEAANVAAGALKRTLSAESKAVTTRLPRESDHSAVTKSSMRHKEWSITSEEGIHFDITLHLGEREPCMVAAGELREGMVLRTDIRTAGGGLLLKQGTRLTEAHLPRLIGAIGATRMVEVADAT